LGFICDCLHRLPTVGIWDLFVIVYTGYRRLGFAIWDLFVIVYTGYRRLEFGIWDFNNLQNIGM
jgi:hypothetical protein